MTVLDRALQEAFALLFPVDCAGCGAPGAALCAGCRAALAPDVIRLELPAPGGEHLAVFAALRLDGPAAEAILALKQRGRTGVAGTLGAALRASLNEAVAGAAGATGPAAEGVRGISFVPVPTSRAAMRRRGYRVADLLLRRAGRRPRRALALVRRVRDQRGLDRGARRRNVDRSMRARIAPGTRVVLVDDVVTTGATLGEARRAIRAAGGEVIAAAVLANTPA